MEFVLLVIGLGALGEVLREGERIAVDLESSSAETASFVKSKSDVFASRKRRVLRTRR